MRSRWHRGGSDTHHPPVEMRFVDMFMTALGSLIFIALLLVILLPKAAQPSSLDTQTLQSELAKLRQDLAKEQQSRQDLQQLLSNMREVDKHVVKRWLSVTLLTKDCHPYEPILYVRWEGPISDFNTGKSMGSMEAFDAGDPKMHRLMGNRYSFVGPSTSLSALPGVTPTSLLNGTRLATTSFFAVGNAPGAWSVYLALKYPRALMGGECVVQPIIHGFSGQAVEGVVKLSLAQPFAWIRRIRLENDGSLTAPPPESDAGFLRELEAFSAEQSQKLCEKTSICGTRDAHWTKRAKPAPPPEALEWRSDARMGSQDDRFAVKTATTVAACERACIDEPRCAAVEHDDASGACSLYDDLGSIKSAPGSRRSIGARAYSPLRWQVDRAVAGDKAARSLTGISQENCAKSCLDDAKCSAVEYYKPTRACNIFESVPKIVPSPLGAYSPTDVGIKTKR